MTRGDNELVEITCELLEERPLAICIDDGTLHPDGRTKDVWLPKSQIEIRHPDKRKPRLLEVNMPVWLALEKGLNLMLTPPGPTPNIMKFTSELLKTICPEIDHFEWHPTTKIVYTVKTRTGHELGRARDPEEAKNLICAFRLGYKMARERNLVITDRGNTHERNDATGLPEARSRDLLVGGKPSK